MGKSALRAKHSFRVIKGSKRRSDTEKERKLKKIPKNKSTAKRKS
jgi:hypothetical protein